MAYCSPTDLMIGNIPLPQYMDANQLINDAADEIDSKIGWRYETPLDNSETGPLSRPARLMLKRINAALATGRIILAVASPEEKNNLHSYGWSLIREANGAINVIADGTVVLEGATLNPVVVEPVAAPLIDNLDAESQVEAFYDRIANPDYSYGFIYPRLPGNPDSLVQ